MKKVIWTFLALLLTMGATLSVMAEEGESYADQTKGAGSWHQFKQDMKEAGHNMGDTGKEIGHGVADGAKKGSKAIKEFFAPSSSSSQGKAKGNSDK